LAFFVLGGVFWGAFNVYSAETGVDSAISGLNKSANKGFLDGSGDKKEALDKAIITDIPKAIGKIIGAGLAFIGLLFFLLVIYGGFLWMTARGNDAQVTKSIDLMTQAVVGLLIVSGAYLLTKFVGQVIIGGIQ